MVVDGGVCLYTLCVIDGQQLSQVLFIVQVMNHHRTVRQETFICDART